MDCIFNKWLKRCEGGKNVGGNGETGVLKRKEEDFFEHTAIL